MLNIASPHKLDGVCHAIQDLNMAQRFFGATGARLTFLISTAASTILVFYGYDQVSTNEEDTVPVARLTG